MTFKVQVTFDAWPYSESFSVNISPEDFPKMDKMVDSITSNLKMRLLSHVRLHHPDIWYQYSPFTSDDLTQLQVPHKDSNQITNLNTKYAQADNTIKGN